MDVEDHSFLAFGPVPSRRLGQSLGINNIPPKSCSYSCVYCQVGETGQQEIVRREFYSPELIYEVVSERIESLRQDGQQIDYLTFVPDGEPTLDTNLNKSITLLKSLDLPIAVISNASLIWQTKVKEALFRADFVSLKVDTIDETIWHQLNRPHSMLRLDNILGGITQFTQEFRGKLTTETMLVKGINDTEQNIEGVARFLQKIEPGLAYIATPTRPPAVTDICPVTETAVFKVRDKFRQYGIKTDLLVSELAGEFGITSDIEQELVNIASVHPLSRQAIETILTKSGSSLSLLDKLLDERKLVMVKFADKIFYIPAAQKYKDKR